MSPRSPTIGNAWSNAFVCMSPYVELTVLQNWKVSTKKVREWCRQLCSQLKKVEIWRKAFSASWNGHFSSSSSPHLLFNVNTISIWHILPSLKSTQYFSPEFSTEDIPSAAGGSIAVAKVNNGLSHSIFSSDVSEYVLYCEWILFISPTTNVLSMTCVCNGKCGLHLKYHIRGNSPLL